MKYDKSFLRNKSLLLRKKKYFTVKKFNYNLIFRLIRKHFYNKKIDELNQETETLIDEIEKWQT